MRTIIALLALCCATAFGAVGPQVRIVRNLGDYGPNLDGLVKDITKIPSTFGIWEAQPGELPPAWQQGDRAGVIRWMRFNLQVVNIGDEPLTIGNIFQAPQKYKHVRGWSYGVNGFWMASLRDEAGSVVVERIGTMLYLQDSVPAIPGMEPLFVGPLSAGLSPGWAAISEPQYHSGQCLDITGVPDGRYTFTVTIGGELFGISEQSESVDIAIRGTDVRYP